MRQSELNTQNASEGHAESTQIGKIAICKEKRLSMSNRSHAFDKLSTAIISSCKNTHQFLRRGKRRAETGRRGTVRCVQSRPSASARGGGGGGFERNDRGSELARARQHGRDTIDVHQLRWVARTQTARETNAGEISPRRLGEALEIASNTSAMLDR